LFRKQRKSKGAHFFKGARIQAARRLSPLPLLPSVTPLTVMHDGSILSCCTRNHHGHERGLKEEDFKAQSTLGVHLPMVKLNNNWVQYSRPEIFWQRNKGTKPRLH